MFQAIIGWFKNIWAFLMQKPEPIPAGPAVPPSAPPPVVVVNPGKPPVMIPGTSGEVCYGPDESHYEPNINFQEVASDNVFSATKATQATNDIDSLFATYWPAMLSAGLIRIAYHFFDPTVDPVEQAKYFLKVVGPLGPYDLLALDFEPLPNKGINGPTIASCASAQKFFDYVDKATNRQTLLYCDEDYLQNYTCMQQFSGRPVWMAYPGHKVVITPKGFPHVAIWQYTFGGVYKGVPQKIDGNIFFGNKAEMLAWIDSLRLV